MRCIVVALQLALYVTGLFVLSAGVSVLAVHHFLNPEGGGGASADTGADTGADGGSARAVRRHERKRRALFRDTGERTVAIVTN